MSRPDRVAQVRAVFKVIGITKRALLVLHDLCELIDEHALPPRPEDGDKSPEGREGKP